MSLYDDHHGCDHDYFIPFVGQWDFPPVVSGNDTMSPFVMTINEYDPITMLTTPLNLVGATVTIQFKLDAWSPMALQISTANAIAITDGVNGVLTINQFLVNIPEGLYNYDCLILTSDGMKRTYYRGIMNVEQPITT